MKQQIDTFKISNGNSNLENIEWKIAIQKISNEEEKNIWKISKGKKLFGKYQMENNNLENIKCKLIIRKISNEEKTIRKISNKKKKKQENIKWKQQFRNYQMKKM